MNVGELDPNTPVLVGVGIVDQHIDDPEVAREPLELMAEAVIRAGQDSGAPQLLRRVAQIAVPHGRWKYSDPGRELARRIGADDARTVRAEVGVLQQTLIGDACERVASGELAAALVVGGEAGHRLRRAKQRGVEASETHVDGLPDVTLHPAKELSSEVERAAGLNRAAGYYAILESAFRARMGWSVHENRERISRMYSAFSTIAASNAYAWRPIPVEAEAIMTATAANPMMAFPYTRAHISSWSVDQAGALLFCSAALATDLGVPAERWVFPLVSTESNHLVNVSNRKNLGRTEAVDAVVEAALAHVGVQADQLTLLDLYSCFPVAVEMFAAALGVEIGTRPLTITGGMPWAGGPYNNYVIQSTAQMALALRHSGKDALGMTTCVSGLLTKIGAGVWSTAAPKVSFANIDVTDDVAERCVTMPIVADCTGTGDVAGYTVLHGPETRGIVVLDVPDARTVACTTDPDSLASMEQDDWIGRRVDVSHGRLVP